MKNFRFIVMCVFPCLILFSCGDDPGPDPVSKINLFDATEVTEIGFTVHWTVENASLADLTIELCCAPDFDVIFKEVMVNDPGQTSQKIDGLKGATKYYVRIIGIQNDGNSLLSNDKSVETGYQNEQANVVTSDGINILGDLYYLNSNPLKSPAMILMGHLSISNMWKGEDLFKNLLAEGYICYIFNFRGHGGSDNWPIDQLKVEDGTLEEYVNTYARADLHACYEYLKKHEKVDSTRIGLMGGSLGANESMIANNWPGVKVSVGLSTSRLGIEEGGVLNNVLFVTSELDCNAWVCFIDEAVYLHNGAVEPKDVITVSGDFHGLDMLVKTGLKEEILDWINARMED